MPPKEARNRRIYRAICIINSMFWMACLGASGFNYDFRWFAFLFAAVPWVLFGAIAGRLRPIEAENNNYFKPVSYTHLDVYKRQIHLLRMVDGQ